MSEESQPIVSSGTDAISEAFFQCEELPASPQSFLGYFAVEVIDISSGKTLFRCKLESSHNAGDTSALWLEEIYPVIETEVAKKHGLDLLHILFYDGDYKKYVLLTEQNANQCTSCVFRVLVSCTSTELQEKKDLNVEAVAAAILDQQEDPLLPTHMKELLEDVTSNPGFTSSQDNKIPYKGKQAIHNEAKQRVQNRMKEREEIQAIEEVVRRQMKAERDVYEATFRACRTITERERERRRKQNALALEEAMLQKEARERQQRLIAEVREFVGTSCVGRAIEDKPLPPIEGDVPQADAVAHAV